MGRWKRNWLATAAVLCGLLVAAFARGQAPKIPARCLSRPPSEPKPRMEISIDTLELKGAELPEGVNQAQFVDAVQESANSGGKWLEKVGNAARDVWRDHGYFQTVVNVQTLANSVDGDVRHVGLRIHVDPGPQYRIAEVRMMDVNPGGKLAFPNETLRDLIPLRPGELVDVEKAGQGIEAIQKLYASHGYIDMTATPDFRMNNQKDQISLFVMLDQGDQYRVGKVVALGFGPTGQKALRSEIKPGEIFDWNLVRDFYARYSWLMPPGASVHDDQIHRDAKTGTVNLLLDFRSCPKQTAPHTTGVSAGSH
jgi:outer membrane translocation and assembly module TamA